MFLLFDIGGTRMRAAMSEDGASFLEPVIFPTPKSFEDGVNLIIKSGKDLCGGRLVDKIVIGVAGSLNKDKSGLNRSPHLSAWEKKSLIDAVGPLSHNVILENDAALAAVGETNFGAGREHKIVAYITIGTGVGGARVVNGRLDVSTWGFEPGHQIIESRVSSSDGTYEYLDKLIGGAGLYDKYKKSAADITDGEIWEEVSRVLAVGLNNMIVHWSPDVVIVGGGLGISAKIDLEKIKENLSSMLKIFPVLPELKKAELGELAGLYGGLAYLKSNN